MNNHYFTGISITSVPQVSTIWSLRGADVERISFESKEKKITLEARKDPIGRFFSGT